MSSASHFLVGIDIYWSQISSSTIIVLAHSALIIVAVLILRCTFSISRFETLYHLHKASSHKDCFEELSKTQRKDKVGNIYVLLTMFVMTILRLLELCWMPLSLRREQMWTARYCRSDQRVWAAVNRNKQSAVNSTGSMTCGGHVVICRCWAPDLTYRSFLVLRLLSMQW